MCLGNVSVPAAGEEKAALISEVDFQEGLP